MAQHYGYAGQPPYQYPGYQNGSNPYQQGPPYQHNAPYNQPPPAGFNPQGCIFFCLQRLNLK